MMFRSHAKCINSQRTPQRVSHGDVIRTSSICTSYSLSSSLAQDALVARFCDRGFENHRCYPFAVVPPTMVAVGRPCGAIYQHQLSGVAALGLSCHSTDASAVSDSNFKRNSAAWHPPTTSFVSRVSFSHDLHICLRQHPEQQHLAAASGMDLPPYV